MSDTWLLYRNDPPRSPSPLPIGAQLVARAQQRAPWQTRWDSGGLTAAAADAGTTAPARQPAVAAALD